MREIKFRAWDTRLNEWLGTPFFINPENGKVHEWADTGLEGYDIPSAILMQYTGLKDKNGTEIYEGDIVEYELGKYKDPDGGYGRDNWELFKERAEIVYDSDKGRFKRKNRSHDFLDTPESEVIGNIYENKELLS